jgi:hypothetical protein
LKRGAARREFGSRRGHHSGLSGEICLLAPHGSNAPADYLEGKTAPCATRELDQYGRTVAVCSVSSLDIDDWLVRRGLAIDYAYYSKGKYRAAQDEASKAHLGIWAGEFIEPRYFRPCMKAGRLPVVCSTH